MIFFMVINMIFNSFVVFRFVLKAIWLITLKYYRLMRRCFDKDYMKEKPEIETEVEVLPP